MKLFGIKFVGRLILVDEVAKDNTYSYPFYCQMMSPDRDRRYEVVLQDGNWNDAEINGWKIKPVYFQIWGKGFRIVYSLVDKDGGELKRDKVFEFEEGEQEKAKRYVEMMFYDANQLTSAYRTAREYNALTSLERKKKNST